MMRLLILLSFFLASASCNVSWTSPGAETEWYMYVPGCVNVEYSGAAVAANVSIIDVRGNQVMPEISHSLSGMEVDVRPFGLYPGQIFVRLETDMGETFDSELFHLVTLPDGDWKATQCSDIVLPSATPSPTTSRSQSTTASTTASRTTTPSNTPSNTPSRTVTPTASVTPSRTASPTSSISPSRTASPTASITASGTPSSTISTSSTTTPSASATPSSVGCENFGTYTVTRPTDTPFLNSFNNLLAGTVPFPGDFVLTITIAALVPNTQQAIGMVPNPATTSVPGDMPIALFFRDDNVNFVVTTEFGNFRGSFETFAVGDQFTIRRVSGTVEVLKGTLLMYSMVNTSTLFVEGMYYYQVPTYASGSFSTGLIIC